LRSRESILFELIGRYGIDLSEDDILSIKEFMRVLKVPCKEDAIRNFLAAYLRLACGWKASDADRIASSSKGRRLWEKKLAELM